MISIILFFISVFCIIYYGIVILYSGIHTSFVKFWPVAAMITAFFAVFLQSNFYLGLPSIIHLLFKIFVTLITILFLILLTMIATTRSKENEEADYLIVLGAIVRGEKPSNALRERIQTAYNYLATHEKCIAILSGYQNQNASISQGKCMQKELRNMGIPAYRLLVENDARTTLENFQFSKEYMTRLQPKVLVVTSDFHLYRSLKIAKKCGYTNIKGISAKTPAPLIIHCYIRELFAIIKDFLRQ
ncbi:MAG: YdcF family protein [Lachnospiraceae bacterium]|nr:YdcF family protein [Lachnospiraceae bacterium]